MVYVPNYSEEQYYPLLFSRESKFIYKLDNCDITQEIELLKSNLGLIEEEEF